MNMIIPCDIMIQRHDDTMMRTHSKKEKKGHAKTKFIKIPPSLDASILHHVYKSNRGVSYVLCLPRGYVEN